MGADSTLFEKNLRALQSRNPELAAKVKAASGALSCYGEAAKAKTGIDVPAFAGGKAMFSLYNPQREAESFFPAGCEVRRFAAVSGMGSALHIRHELQKSESRILAIEKNADSIKTLFAQFDFSDLLQNPNFRLTTAESAAADLCAFYLPQLHGGFLHLQNRAWVQHNAGEAAAIAESLKSALSQISADYSVQAHFGKIWMRNIFQNLRILSAQKLLPAVETRGKKRAAIIAAGPSLDQSLPLLRKLRGETYIVATDTASLILVRQGIAPDTVVTIDGQNISYRHFMAQAKGAEVLFVNDLCAHPLVAKTARQNGQRVLFMRSAHPLCAYVNDYNRRTSGGDLLESLDTSSGTVTIAAVDFAVKAGFAELALFGADFAYTNRKPYARASYLDDTFGIGATRTGNAETAFTALMFRTETEERTDKALETPVMNRYAQALQDYLAQTKSAVKVFKAQGEKLLPYFEAPKANNARSCANFFGEALHIGFDYADFILWAIGQMAKADAENDAALKTALLPFAAWCERKGIYKSGRDSFSKVLEAAQRLVGRYRELL